MIGLPMTAQLRPGSSRSLGWAGRAACRNRDPDQFFDQSKEAVAEVAARLCNVRCPVRLECLEYAVAEDIDVGIWGGMDTRQRRAWARQQAAQQAA